MSKKEKSEEGQISKSSLTELLKLLIQIIILFFTIIQYHLEIRPFILSKIGLSELLVLESFILGVIFTLSTIILYLKIFYKNL